MNPPTLDQAKAAFEHWARTQNVGLVWPGDPLRDAIIYAMAALHGLTGTGWDLAYAQENLSVTLPGAGSTVVGALQAIPYVGGLLGLAASKMEHPFICISPAAMRDPVALLATMVHEMGHVGSIRAGGLGWCIAYGLVPEARAAGEAPCYGAGMAVHHHMGGVPVGVLVVRAQTALDKYGLDEESKALASGILQSNALSLEAGADPGGVLADTYAALSAVGWEA